LYRIIKTFQQEAFLGDVDNNNQFKDFLTYLKLDNIEAEAKKEWDKYVEWNKEGRKVKD
jgi:hypothetical protein